MRWTVPIVMLALALSISAPASVALAQGGGCDVACSDPGCDSCRNSCCGGLVADVEMTLLRYSQEDGVTDAIGAPVEFDCEFAPRFELGYVGSGGLGLRTRYWELDGAATSVVGSPVGVDAYNIDLEAFQEYCPGCNTTIELCLGVRYAELWEDSAAGIDVRVLGLGGFSGFGGTMAAGSETRRAQGRNLWPSTTAQSCPRVRKRKAWSVCPWPASRTRGIVMRARAGLTGRPGAVPRASGIDRGGTYMPEAPLPQVWPKQRVTATISPRRPG